MREARDRTKTSWDALIARGALFRERGLCISCGDPVVEGRLRCEKHLRYYRDRMRHKRRRWAKDGICIRCGKRPARPGMIACQECADSRNALGWAMYHTHRIHHTSCPCHQPGAKHYSDDWDEVTCERCLALTGREL